MKAKRNKSRGWVKVLPLYLFPLSPFFALAQTQADSLTVVTRSTMFGIGPTKILDTYLSGQHFSGSGVSLLISIERQRPGHRWSTLMEHEANFSSAKDSNEKQQDLEGAYNFYWGKLYSWKLFNNRLKVQAGGLVNASLGFIYNNSNSNNPAQARLHLNIMPTGVATYDFMLFKKPFTARYQLSLPLAGITFAPNYGQSYYELFSRGDYDHNVVPTTFVSAPEWRHTLTVDMHLSRGFSMRLGYLGNIQQQKVNGLRQHVWTHRFLFGLTKKFSIIPRTL